MYIKGAFTLGNPYRALSTCDPKSPVCSTSVNAPFCAHARYALLALAGLEEVGFGAVRMHMHKHGAPALLWLLVEDSPPIQTDNSIESPDRDSEKNPRLSFR